jgi:hypothetical protein
VEGTGAYGAGLSRYLQSCGLVVIEVDRTNRQVRRMQGKSDPVDAIEAAAPRCRVGVGNREDHGRECGSDPGAARRAQRSGRQARARCLNQIPHLGFTSPDQPRERFLDSLAQGRSARLTTATFWLMCRLAQRRMRRLTILAVAAGPRTGWKALDAAVSSWISSSPSWRSAAATFDSSWVRELAPGIATMLG